MPASVRFTATQFPLTFCNPVAELPKLRRQPGAGCRTNSEAEYYLEVLESFQIDGAAYYQTIFKFRRDFSPKTDRAKPSKKSSLPFCPQRVIMNSSDALPKPEVIKSGAQRKLQGKGIEYENNLPLELESNDDRILSTFNQYALRRMLITDN